MQTYTTFKNVYLFFFVSFDWTGRQQGRRQTGRTRNSRRRQASHLQMNLFDDSQGNNYEV